MREYNPPQVRPVMADLSLRHPTHALIDGVVPVIHQKGGHYILLCVAKCSETLAERVIYQSRETGEIWDRPKAMFDDNVVILGHDENKDIVEKTVERFRIEG